MDNVRRIARVLPSRPTIEGAGVRLKRAFGPQEVPLLDPFLLLDDFHSRDFNDYVAGFPWHPHRGIETVTYMLSGEVEHEDSLGNKGVIGPGDLQWMTAGSGIIHQEMPRRQVGLVQGFQLWVNLPAARKMTEPKYRDIRDDSVPTITVGAATIRVICGEVGGVAGPVADIVVEPQYFDITIEPHAEFDQVVKIGHKVFVYVVAGGAYFDEEARNLIGEENLVIFGDGDTLKFRAASEGVRFLLVSGKPIGEPIAWRGPIVMNTQAELRAAFDDYEAGNFIKGS